MSHSTETTVAPQVLLVNHFKALKLPTFARDMRRSVPTARAKASITRVIY